MWEEMVAEGGSKITLKVQPFSQEDLIQQAVDVSGVDQEFCITSDNGQVIDGAIEVLTSSSGSGNDDSAAISFESAEHDHGDVGGDERHDNDDDDDVDNELNDAVNSYVPANCLKEGT